VQATVGTVDVAVTKSPLTIQATVGTPVTYVITVLNQGSLPANNVTMIETLPTGLMFDPAFNTASGEPHMQIYLNMRHARCTNIQSERLKRWKLTKH